MKMLISILLLSFSFLMFFFNHPLSMGLMVLLQTLLTCMLTGMMIKTYWFSYILFLTFLGGLLVLFIYVSSIASNEMMKISFIMKTSFYFIFSMICIILFLMYFNMNWLNLNNNMPEFNNFFNIMFFNNENNINLNKLYNSKTFLMMMMMVIYLFITLLVIVKITNIFYGPLRSN
uniref:NADH-ubiquinone oxidoreductase chain 6 n=1 Tax=Epicopeia hainesii TaxID=691109 RepID=A0A5Q0U1T9_9NEOP|nr:NADH dehydrogenase subunit 6 [Epicopeia hainesii]QGA74576.1 NADH dehydrogenase subunit 6 [Epicopeia hainesii]